MRVLDACRCAALALALLYFAAPAAAEPVVVLGPGGAVRTVAVPAAGLREPAAAPAPRAAAARRPARRRPTVRGELRRLLAEQAITLADHDAHRAVYDAARRTAERLEGVRRTELTGALDALEDIAGAGALTASRMRPLWRTVDANVRWWTQGPLPAPAQRVQVAGSEILWQYVPGQGLQFHPLGNFGRLNGLWSARNADARLAVLYGELLAMAVDRDGAPAWEYHYRVGAGAPPWVSGMAQATAVQALARAGIRLGRKEEALGIGRRALRIFELPPPAGVRVPSPSGGSHYLLYSFDPDLRVLNGFLQALIGLHDFAAYANDPAARALFADGELAARTEVLAHDTGAWSLYAVGRVQREADVHYHRLARDFLGGLCARTSEPVHCDAHARYRRYVVEPPRLEVLTTAARAGRRGKLRFRLSKAARVSVEVTGPRGTVLARALPRVPYGEHAVQWRAPKRGGAYVVRISAVDLAGNPASVTGDVTVRGGG